MNEAIHCIKYTIVDTVFHAPRATVILNLDILVQVMTQV